MNELHLFAGGGGGILGGLLLGHRPVCAVEIDPYCRKILLQRQRDGILPPFPIWDDVRTFDGKPWAGKVDIVCGGFPCQDVSIAGKGEGLTGERSGLWFEMFRIICEIRPKIVFVENSPALSSRGLGTVLGNLASIGYDAEWDVFGARHVGAPHTRDRIWIIAYLNSNRGDERAFKLLQSQIETTKRPNPNSICKKLSNSEGIGLQTIKQSIRNAKKHPIFTCCRWWVFEPDLVRVAHGISNRVDRIKALGNAQIPAVVRSAFEALSE